MIFLAGNFDVQVITYGIMATAAAESLASWLRRAFLSNRGIETSGPQGSAEGSRIIVSSG